MVEDEEVEDYLKDWAEALLSFDSSFRSLVGSTSSSPLLLSSLLFLRSRNSSLESVWFPSDNPCLISFFDLYR